jgi:hypothetical protein
MNPQQVARAGEMFVAAEIHRRGGYAVTFAGNMPGIDILASDLADSRRISIQVKSKSSGSWHARFPRDAAECGDDPDETCFWIFVDLGGEHPAYFIAPPVVGAQRYLARSHCVPRSLRAEVRLPAHERTSWNPGPPGRTMA